MKNFITESALLQLINFLIPREIQEYFEIQAVIDQEDCLEVHAEEKNIPPPTKIVAGERLESKGFRTKPSIISCIPLKGRRVEYHLKRRSWIKIREGKRIEHITRKFEFKAEGMRITTEYAEHLKAEIEGEITDISRVARRHHLVSDTLNKWYRRFMTDMEESAEENVVIPEQVGEHISIDEVTLFRGDQWTILANRASKKIKQIKQFKGKAFAIIKGTKIENLRKYIDKIPVQARYQVKTFTRDMKDSYDWLGREYFPNAMQIIDKFHVMTYIYEAVQEIRVMYRKKELAREKAQLKKIKKAEQQTGQKITIKIFRYENGDSRKELLFRCRGLLFKPQHKWTAMQAERSVILFREYPLIKRVYDLAQSFREIYDQQTDRDQAQALFKQWYEQVEHSKIAAMISAKEMVQRHEGFILNYFDVYATNAYAESLNAKIKLFKLMVKGIRVPRFFIYRLSTYIC